METNLHIDFLSGYNPVVGFKTCDYIYTPKLDLFFDTDTYTILGVNDSSVSFLWCRNAIHHIKDLNKLVKEFYRVLSTDGFVVVVECREEYFANNVLLDTIWYRGITQREEVWFSHEYRNYEDVFVKHGFFLYHSSTDKEKEIKKFKKVLHYF